MPGFLLLREVLYSIVYFTFGWMQSYSNQVPQKIKLAELISVKWNKIYSQARSHIQVRVCYLILQSPLVGLPLEVSKAEDACLQNLCPQQILKLFLHH